MTQPNSEPTEAARKCYQEILIAREEYPTKDNRPASIIQRHMDAYHSEQSKELRESHRELVDALQFCQVNNHKDNDMGRRVCLRHECPVCNRIEQALIRAESLPKDTAMKGTKAEVLE